LYPPDGMLDLVLADDTSAGRTSVGTDTGPNTGKGKKR